LGSRGDSPEIVAGEKSGGRAFAEGVNKNATFHACSSSDRDYSIL
jgi:hypothetical protein